MNNLTQIRRLKKLHACIQTASTGSPKALAKRFGISQRSLYNLIDMLKDLDAVIHYCRKRKTYYYEDESFDINVEVKIEVTNKGVVKTLSAIGK